MWSWHSKYFLGAILSALLPSGLQALGDLVIFIDPPEVILEGAQWRVQGEVAWRDSGTTAFGLQPGNVNVEFKPVFGYREPPVTVVPISDNELSAARGTYVLDIPDLNIRSIVQDPEETVILDVGDEVLFSLFIEDGFGNPVSEAFVEVNDPLRGGIFQTGLSDGSGNVSYATTVPTGISDGLFNLQFVAKRTNANDSGIFSRQVSITSHIISLSGDLAFGDVIVDSFARKTMTITSVGGSPLNITSIAYPSSQFSDAGFNTLIPAHGSQVITVIFIPDAETSFGGDLIVNSNATTGNNRLPLSGRGVPLPIDPPATVTATKGEFQNFITVFWSSAPEVEEYEIWRGTLNNINFAGKVGTRSELTFSDFSINPGTIYYYWVRSKKNAQVSEFSNPDSGFALGIPQNVTASDGAFLDKIEITWNAVPGADSYAVFRNTANLSAEAIQVGGSTGPLFKDETIEPGITYFFWVEAIKNGVASPLSFSNSGFALATPGNIKASDGAASNEVSVSWDFVIGASRYTVYRNTTEESREATSIATLPGTRFDDSTAVPGTVYFYWITVTGTEGLTSGLSNPDSGYIAAPRSLNDGLVAFFPFQGDTRDESGNLNNGIDNGSQSATGRFGKEAGARSLDGVDDFIEIPATASLRVSRFTLSVWLKTNTAPSIGNATLFSGKHDILGSQFGGFQLSLQSDGKIVGENYTAPIMSFGAASTSAVTDDRWHQVVVTWDGTRYKMYLDSQLEAESEALFPGSIAWLPSITSLYIGKNQEGNFYKGMLDDMRLYNRALEEKDIEDLHAATTGKAAELKVAGEAGLVNEGTEFMGNIYNGFELMGPTAVFSSIPGEITRISFLDPGGDLVFAEFGSSDPDVSLLVSLVDDVEGVPSPYNQPTTFYEQGLASFTINNSNETTFFSVFTLGNDPSRVDLALINSATLSNPADGIADVKLIRVRPQNDLGGTADRTRIGGINAANADFSASSGVLGIDAGEIAVNLFLFVGDMTPSGKARPWLRIHPSSSIPEILINGGDLGEATGPFQIDTNGIVYPFPIRATEGQRSIRNSSSRPDLGDGRLPPVADTFAADGNAYFLTGGQNSEVVSDIATFSETQFREVELASAVSPSPTAAAHSPESFKKPEDGNRVGHAAAARFPSAPPSVLPAQGDHSVSAPFSPFIPLWAFLHDIALEEGGRVLYDPKSAGFWIWLDHTGWFWTSPQLFPLLWAQSLEKWVQVTEINPSGKSM